MRNALLTITILFCLATASTAADQKKSAQLLQSNQTEQIHVARNDASGSMDADASMSSDCVPKTSSQSKKKSAKDDPEGDPRASQNQVEYGGAG